MHKTLLVILLASCLCAGEFFKETRYIYAIDQTIEYEGEITFKEGEIRIFYMKPQVQNISYFEEDEDPIKQSFFLILRSIREGNDGLLEEFFEAKKEEDKTVLLPQGILKDFIKKVEYKKDGKKLEFLQIQMQNDDRIKIETVR